MDSPGSVQHELSRACSSLRTGRVKTIKMTNEPIKEILGTPKHPDSVPTEKSNNNDCVITTIPLVSECQLTAATGGAELSCYRCTIPFGVILIAGTVVTAVAYIFNSHGSIISVFGLVLLSSGLVLLASSAVCWKIRQHKKKAKRRESQTALVANQRTLFG
ncbi:LOW QUALITY PROTEIN: transmembrane protein 100 [Geothlypis trichas]